MDTSAALNRALNARPMPERPLVVFDTKQAVERDKFGLWRSHVADVLASFDFDPLEDQPFHARMETLSIGQIKINRGDSSTGRWVRRSYHLADGREHFAFYLAGGGAFRMVQGDIDTVQGPGHFALIDDGKPSEVHVESSLDDYGFVLPQDLLREARGRNNSRPLPGFGPSNGGLRLLRGFLDAIYASPGDIADPLLAQKLCRHLLDLIVLAFEPSRDAAHVAQNRGLKVARVQAILAAIDRGYQAPDISSKAIAAELNISQRYLHQLLEERGLTFSHIVLEKRLDRALAMLRDPELDSLRIGQIAYDCGFNDLSYFNRRFRARFGETPGGVRGKAA